MSDHKSNSDLPDSYDPELEEGEEHVDDTIIGVAFRRSLIAFAALALIIGGVVWWLQQEEELGEEVELLAEAPQQVEATSLQIPDLPFVDVTAEAGIDFKHENGAQGEKLLPETMGSGAAFFDPDSDGDLDLFLVNGTQWPHTAGRKAASSALYRNDGSGRFENVTSEMGLTTDFYGTGVAIGDVDGDGRPDIFIAAVGSNHLYLNRGASFEDVTSRAGVAGADDMWSTSAAFGDFDRDGDLDLFVCNYVQWSRQIDAEVDYRLTGVGRAYGPPVNYRGTFSYLYRNLGDGTFEDISEAAGLHVRNPATDVPVGKGLGVSPVDIDGDGYLDLLVANDTVQNFLFHNKGDGTFEETGELFGLAYGRAGEATGAMGIDAAHYRNDSDLGFAIGNFANEMTSLYMSQGDATLFVDEAITDGIGAPSRTALSFGVLFFDADLDGRLDLVQTNGHLENEIQSVDPSQSYEQPAQLFWNAGAGARSTFVDVPLEKLGDLDRPLVGRSSAYGDIDGDGDLDLILTQAGREPLLLRNDQATGSHWLRLKLSQPGANSQAIGAWVEARVGDLRLRRQVMPTRGYQSQSDSAITLGLGQATALDGLDILWPDGTRQTVDPGGLGIDQVVEIHKG